VLPPEPAQLFSFLGGELFTLSGVALVLPEPPSQGLAGYHEVLGHLGDRLARGAVELDGFPLEFRRIVWCWSRHPDLLSGGLIVPTLGCPSYRGKPTRFVLGDTHYDAKNPKESCARGERFWLLPRSEELIRTLIVGWR
jgi:hypothetical protein